MLPTPALALRAPSPPQSAGTEEELNRALSPASGAVQEWIRRADAITRPEFKGDRVAVFVDLWAEFHRLPERGKTHELIDAAVAERIPTEIVQGVLVVLQRKSRTVIPDLLLHLVAWPRIFWHPEQGLEDLLAGQLADRPEDLRRLFSGEKISFLIPGRWVDQWQTSMSHVSPEGALRTVMQQTGYSPQDYQLTSEQVQRSWPDPALEPGKKPWSFQQVSVSQFHLTFAPRRAVRQAAGAEEAVGERIASELRGPFISPPDPRWEPFAFYSENAADFLEAMASTGADRRQDSDPPLIRKLRRDESLLVAGLPRDTDRYISRDGRVLFFRMGDTLTIQMENPGKRNRLLIQEGSLFFEDGKRGRRLEVSVERKGKRTVLFTETSPQADLSLVRGISYWRTEEGSELALTVDERVERVKPGARWDRTVFSASPLIENGSSEEEEIRISLRSEEEPAPPVIREPEQPRAPPSIWWAGNLPLLQVISGDARVPLLSLDLHVPELSREALMGALELVLVVERNGKEKPLELPIAPERMQFGEGMYGPFYNNYRVRIELPAEARPLLQRTGHLRFHFKFRLKEEEEWKDTALLPHQHHGIGEIVSQPDWLFQGGVYTINAKAWGSFDAIRNRLDDLVKLGMKVLNFQGVEPTYMTVFEIDDYRKADPVLGGEEALKRLLAEAKKKGLRSIKSFVPGHSSPRNPLLQEHPELYYRPAEPNWIPDEQRVVVDVRGTAQIFMAGNVFKDPSGEKLPDGAPRGEIQGGFGRGTVQFALWKPEVREWLTPYWVETLNYWNSLGFDGFYTDTGHSIWRIAPGWLEDLQRRLRMENPDLVVGFESHWGEGGGFIMRGGSFAQRFELYDDGLRKVVKGTKTAAELAQDLSRVPLRILRQQMGFLENHDEERIALHLEWSPILSALQPDANRAFTALLTLGMGVIPHINNGQESGATVRMDVSGRPWAEAEEIRKGVPPENYPWRPFDPFDDNSDRAQNLRDFISNVFRMRAENPAFWRPESVRFLSAKAASGQDYPHAFVSYLTSGGKRALFVANLDPHAKDPNKVVPILVDLSPLGLSPAEAAAFREAAKSPSLVSPAASSLDAAADTEKDTITYFRLKMVPFQVVAVEFEVPAQAGTEEALIVPPVNLDRPAPTQVWRDGWGIFPSVSERMRRTAFMQAPGGPAQFLRIAGSVKLEELADYFGSLNVNGNLLVNFLPQEGLSSGFIDHSDVPLHVRLLIRKHLDDFFTQHGIKFEARILLPSGDMGIPLRPINLWRDGALRLEGLIPAEPIFVGDHVFQIEMRRGGSWYRLPGQGWMRIEAPNPAQIASQPNSEDLAVGLQDAKEELQLALHNADALEAEASFMEEGPGKRELLEAVRLVREDGIVTEWVLPMEQRTPLLRMMMDQKLITPAQARKAFIASQQAAGIQKGFFVGMQFKTMLLPDGQRLMVMYNPNRANTPRPPKPKEGEALPHPLSDRIFKVVMDGQVRSMPQRSQPAPNGMKLKINPFGYVFGHGTLPTREQVAQLEWSRPIDTLVDEAVSQRDRLTVIAGNIGAKASASLPDWAHVHDVPWRVEMDNPGDGKTFWFRLEDGIRTGVLRDPKMTVFVLESSLGNGGELKEQGNRIIAQLKELGLEAYNPWAAVTNGLERLFILPRNPVEPEPSNAENWEPVQDYAKPLADQDYWAVEVAPGQYRLMGHGDMLRAGLKQVDYYPGTQQYLGNRPLIRKGRPVVELKMGSMEARKVVLSGDLNVYEDPLLEARLIKSYELIGLPWSDPRVTKIIESMRQPGHELDRDSDAEVTAVMQQLESVQDAQGLVELMGRVSEWRTRHVMAFNRLSGTLRDRFNWKAEELISRFAKESPDLVREVEPPSLLKVGWEGRSLHPLVLVSLNPALDRGVRRVRENGSVYLEVWTTAGGSPANIAQASAAMGRPTTLAAVLSGETGEKAALALKKFGVDVLRVPVQPDQPQTRVSLMVLSDRPGRRERRLIGHGAPVSPELANRARMTVSEAFQTRAYTLGFGERWPGQESNLVAEVFASWLAWSQRGGRRGFVSFNDSWGREAWNHVLRVHPEVVSTPVSALARFLYDDRSPLREKENLLRTDPDEVARQADKLRRAFGINEWIVPLGEAGEVLVTEKGWWHVVPSPVIELTYLNGATDVSAAQYLARHALGDAPQEAALAGVTSSTLFMERKAAFPVGSEIGENLFRAQINVLAKDAALAEPPSDWTKYLKHVVKVAPAKLSASEILDLETSVSRRMQAFVEARQGNALAVVPSHLLRSHPALQEFLSRLPRELASAVVVWEHAQERPSAREEANGLRVFHGSMLDFAGYLQGHAGTLHLLGDEQTAGALRILMAGTGIEVYSRPLDLSTLIRALGVPDSVLGQVDPDELLKDLARLRSA